MNPENYKQVVATIKKYYADQKVSTRNEKGELVARGFDDRIIERDFPLPYTMWTADSLAFMRRNPKAEPIFQTLSRLADEALAGNTNAQWALEQIAPYENVTGSKKQISWESYCDLISSGRTASVLHVYSDKPELKAFRVERGLYDKPFSAWTEATDIVNLNAKDPAIYQHLSNLYWDSVSDDPEVAKLAIAELSRLTPSKNGKKISWQDYRVVIEAATKIIATEKLNLKGSLDNDPYNVQDGLCLLDGRTTVITSGSGLALPGELLSGVKLAPEDAKNRFDAYKNPRNLDVGIAS